MITKLYDPKFDVFHEKPVVTWNEAPVPVINTLPNLFELYQHWLNGRSGKHDPGEAFWASNGPAIYRALTYCRCKALVMTYEGDRKVSYRWFGRWPDPNVFVPDAVDNHSWAMCPVQADNLGGANGTRVRVTLPTDEDVVFTFSQAEMKRWLKDEPKPVAS